MIQSTVNILLVEDNEVDVEAVKRAFAKQRIANPIHVASDGVQALELLRGDFLRPFLIILDINLPRMNGIEFLQEVRKDPELKDSVVFVLTTSKRDEDKVASYDLNVAGYMVKEAVGKDFMRLTDMLGSYWRIVELPPARG